MAELNCVTQFWPRITEMYGYLLTSNELYSANQDIQIINIRDIRLLKTTVSGYRDHNHRTLPLNTSSCGSDFGTKTLDHDRDIEFATDSMDVGETSQIISLTSIQSYFEKTQATPESDRYTFSKLYTEVKCVDVKTSNTAITAANTLPDFDANVGAMEEAGVPLGCVIMYCTPAFKTELRNAEDVQRTLEVSGDAKNIDRHVRSLDDISTIKTAPASCLETTFDFTEGPQVVGTGKQIDYIMIDPKAQVSRVKHSYIKAFTPGHDNHTADKYLYQNRRSNGIFTLLDDLLKQGRIINAETEG